MVSGSEIFDTVNKVNVGVGFDLTGTIYVDSTLNGAMYCNPVYETSTGEIFSITSSTTIGSEISFSSVFSNLLTSACLGV